MKNIQKQNITELSEFNVSLWQMIPSGKGKGIALLRKIVDSILNNNNKSKIPSILITGKEGKRTHSRAFIRALGIENIDETHASLLQPGSDVVQFFGSQNTAHIITGAECLWVATQSVIIQICKNNRFHLYNYMKQKLDTFEVPGPLLLTAEDADKVPIPILDAVDFVIEIEKYTREQLELVVLQRLRYCVIDYECEAVLNGIAEYGRGSLREVGAF